MNFWGRWNIEEEQEVDLLRRGKKWWEVKNQRKEKMEEALGVPRRFWSEEHDLTYLLRNCNVGINNIGGELEAETVRELLHLFSQHIVVLWHGK